MAKYGRGFNREIVGAVNQEHLVEPLTTDKIRRYSKSRGWDISENYINVALSNGSSPDHSLTYVKYFEALGSGEYEVKKQFKGARWI